VCCDNRSVGGVEDRRERRGTTIICECREVRSENNHRHHHWKRGRYNDWCGCRDCERDRNGREENRFECVCREVND